MLVRTSKSAWKCFLLCSVLAFSALAAKEARAQESIIRQPGNHPNYGIEIEPHLLASFLLTRAGEGVGIGGRFTIPVVKNGFISSINNNVGIGFGLDWAHYNGCYYYYYYDPRFGYDCPSFNTFIIPVVMQWNFFLGRHWSVFGEPGLAFEYGTFGSCPGYYVDARGVVHNYPCPVAPNHFNFDPFVLFVGGRYHFSDGVALTMRIGWPYFSFGVSFMP
jgi:hypothetical protein